MDFLIATHNMKKRAELERILSPLGINVKTADELGIDLTDVEETGATFEENAKLKADSGCKESGMPCIADDSGLMVDALDGAPGVYSARFAGDHGNDEKNNDKLLDCLKDVPDDKRTAKYVACVCFSPTAENLPSEANATVKSDTRERALTASVMIRFSTLTAEPLRNTRPRKRTR